VVTFGGRGFRRGWRCGFRWSFCERVSRRASVRWRPTQVAGCRPMGTWSVLSVTKAKVAEVRVDSDADLFDGGGHTVPLSAARPLGSLLLFALSHGVVCLASPPLHALAIYHPVDDLPLNTAWGEVQTPFGMDVIVLILTRRGDGEVRPARSSPQEANLPGKRDEVSEEQFFRRIVRHVIQCWEEVVSKGERLLPIQFWKSYDTGRHLSRQRTETHQIEEIERGVLTKRLSLPPRSESQ
jgi:hypothetical protein